MHSATKRLFYITLAIELVLGGLWVRSMFAADSCFLSFEGGSVGAVGFQGQVILSYLSLAISSDGIEVDSRPLEEEERGFGRLKWAPGWSKFSSPSSVVALSYSVNVPYWMIAISGASPLMMTMYRSRAKRKEVDHA